MVSCGAVWCDSVSVGSIFVVPIEVIVGVSKAVLVTGVIKS